MEGADAQGVEDNSPFLPSFPTIDSFSQSALRSILLSSKHSNQLPGEKKADWDYYSTFPAFRNVMSAENNVIRSLLRAQLSYNNIKAKLSSNADVSELVDILSDCNDSILERVSLHLDEAAGIRKEADPLLLEVSTKFIIQGSGSWNNFNRAVGTGRREKENGGDNSQPVKLLTAKNIVRPQLKFSKFIDNSEKTSFIPRLTEKPHALKPLSILVEYTDSGTEFYSHPYLFEMERFEPSEWQLAFTVPARPPSVEETELIYVKTLEQLRIAIAELEAEEVIGVDVEHHFYRSYLGISCLIQISTFSKDFIIDPLEIWAEMPLLNQIMANPKIVKVLHGCESDVEWLQRDFSVYLVNVFDTHQAGKLLGLPRLSLAWLLQHYCGLEVDKKFQLADWRIRPIPEEMLLYARQDTRCLTYLYSRLKNELIGKGNESSNLLLSCIHASQDVAKTRYVKPVLTPDSHMAMVRKARASLDSRQMWAVTQLFAWRDKIARVEDESTAFVLPNHMLLKICLELPREMQGILACCNPVPPLVKQNLGILHQIILAARDKPKQAAELEMEADVSLNSSQHLDVDVLENPLVCPLDLSHFADSGDLESVISPTKPSDTRFTWANNNLVKAKPDLSVFSSPGELRNLKSVKFVGPYQRYLQLKPYLESLKETPENSAEPPKEARTDQANLRLESISKHFALLTEMTPKRAEKRPLEEEEDEEEYVEESDDEVEPLEKKPYFPDPDKPYKEVREWIPNMREGAQMKSKRSGKPNNKGSRKKGVDNEETIGPVECNNSEENPVKESTSEDNHIKGEKFKRMSLDSQFNNRKGFGEGKKRQSLDSHGGAFKKAKKEFSQKGVDGQPKEFTGKKGHNWKKSNNTAEGGGQVFRKPDGNSNPNPMNQANTPESNFDYKNVDFSKFGQKSNQREDHFDPNRKGKKDRFKGGGKQKQKFKNGGKSSTFNQN